MHNSKHKYPLNIFTTDTNDHTSPGTIKKRSCNVRKGTDLQSKNEYRRYHRYNRSVPLFMGHLQRKWKRKAEREADIAGLWPLVLCQALFPGDPVRVAEVQSGKPGGDTASEGRKSILRTFIMPVILPVPLAPFSPVATR